MLIFQQRREARYSESGKDKERSDAKTGKASMEE